MSDFDEWWGKGRLQHRNPAIKTLGVGDEGIAGDIFNAGMERAAEIAENNETDCINASDHYGCSQGSYIAEAIRKEIV